MSSIYIRLKHKKQTVFLWCNSSGQISLAKERLAKIINKDAKDIKFYSSDKSTVLADESTFGDAQLESNAIVYWVERTSGNNYEDIQVPNLDSDANE